MVRVSAPWGHRRVVGNGTDVVARDTAAHDLEMLFGRGEVAPAEALIEANGRDVFRYFARRVASTDDAADLTGEVMLVVWRNAQKISSDPLAARMWTFGVARNVLSNHLRGVRRRNRLERRLIDTYRFDSDDTDLRETVAGAVSLLAPIDQEIVRLVHWEGFSLAEIAAILHRKPATVRSRYSRARQRLAATLSAPEPPSMRSAGGGS